MTEEEDKIIIEVLKTIEGQKRKLLSLVKKPKPQKISEEKGKEK